MDACPGHILESTKGIEMKLATYIYVKKRKCSRQEPYILPYILLKLPLIKEIIKCGFLCHVFVFKALDL